MQVRPLRRFRVYENGKITSQHGDHRYITQGDCFFIIKMAARNWVVTPYGGSRVDVKDAVKDAGVHDTIFTRRIDAIEALEHIVGEFE